MRRLGNPRTEEERAARHELRYPGEPLPPRGTGLGLAGDISADMPSLGNAVIYGVASGVGLAIGYAIFQKLKR
jgi:hypothetical protein